MRLWVQDPLGACVTYRSKNNNKNKNKQRLHSKIMHPMWAKVLHFNFMFHELKKKKKKFNKKPTHRKNNFKKDPKQK